MVINASCCVAGETIHHHTCSNTYIEVKNKCQTRLLAYLTMQHYDLVHEAEHRYICSTFATILHQNCVCALRNDYQHYCDDDSICVESNYLTEFLQFYKFVPFWSNAMDHVLICRNLYGRIRRWLKKRMTTAVCMFKQHECSHDIRR